MTSNSFRNKKKKKKKKRKTRQLIEFVVSPLMARKFSLDLVRWSFNRVQIYSEDISIADKPASETILLRKVRDADAAAKAYRASFYYTDYMYVYTHTHTHTHTRAF